LPVKPAIKLKSVFSETKKSLCGDRAITTFVQIVSESLQSTTVRNGCIVMPIVKKERLAIDRTWRISEIMNNAQKMWGVLNK